MKSAKKFLSMLLAIMMIFSIIPITSIETEAVSYSGSSSYMNGKYYTQLCKVTLTGDGATDIVNIAKSQVGYKSGSSNSDLSGSTSSTSNVKYSEYGRVIGSNPNDWCAYFVSWCARQAGISTSVLPNFAGCTTAYNKTLPNAGCTMHRRTSGYTPQKGDIIFFGDSSDYIYHVGIVTSANSSTVYYIDGNNVTTIPHCVANSSKSLSSTSIWGYATPNYKTTETHNHSYTKIGYEAAHPHKCYYYCSCGKTGDYTGATKILTSCSSCMVKSTKWPVPLKAYTLNTGKTTVYDAPGGLAKSNKIYDTDLCTITAIYTNGWCKVTFPLDAGGTDSGYVKTSVFLDTSYTVFTMKASAKITTYSRSSLGTSIGYADSGDTIYICDHTSSAVQIAYPLSSGGYKVGWVPNSWFKFTVKYNANGGTGSMSSSTAQYQGGIAVAENKFTKTGYTFNGWNMQRASDSKWYYKNKGWYLSSAVSSTDTKAVYTAGRTYNMDYSWVKGAKTKDTITFYATWRANILSTYYNANGGTINSDTYKLSNDLIYYISDGTKYVQKWTYNTAKTNGLVNAGTFGLSKKGYTFSGWGTKASGGTVFDQDDTGLLPVEINSALKDGDCSTTLYAIWKPNTYTIKYNANGGTGSMSSSSHTYDTAKALTANSFTRTGYTFLGWSTSSSATTPTYTDKQSVKNLTSTNGGTVTLYAVWQKDIVTVTLSSVSVSQKPNKTEYTVGDTLDTSGLKLKLTYSDGSTKEITSGFRASSPDMSTAGTKTVTVKYNGLTTTFTVTVSENTSVYDAYVYTEAKKSVVQGSQFTYTVSLSGTYDGFSFEIASGNGLTVMDIVTTNSNINIDKIGDRWMVSVLGGLAKTNAEKEELVTVTVQVASDAELGERTLALSNIMLSSESGDKVSAIKYEYASIEITDQIPGDINGDGTFDYYDVSKLYAYYRNKTTLSESVDTDINGDGNFDYYDVSKLYAIYRGKANFN